jgi:hypothetical protein
MKCVKNLKTGEIIRVDDKKAEQMVGSSWNYVAKMEWKTATRKPKVVEEAKAVADSSGTETIAKKQLKRKKNGK